VVLAEPAPVEPVLLPTWPEAVLAEPAPVEPVLLPTCPPDVVLAEPAPVEPVLLATPVDIVCAEPWPVEPVLLPTSLCVLSSPLPVLPPATSPRVSELFSVVSRFFD
jgi:hypothetical protein